MYLGSIDQAKTKLDQKCYISLLNTSKEYVQCVEILLLESAIDLQNIETVLSGKINQNLYDILF